MGKSKNNRRERMREEKKVCQRWTWEIKHIQYKWIQAVITYETLKFYSQVKKDIWI
jgi:hypothetical protein